MQTSQPLPAKYLLELGSTPELSWAELESLYGEKVERTDTNLATLNHPSASATQVVNTLGGTVKIFSILEELDLSTSSQEVEEKILTTLSTSSKIKFFVAELNRHHLPALELSSIKIKLAEAGHSVRYLRGPRQGLSAALLRHKSGIRELAVINTPLHILLCETQAVQDIDDWTKRDRGKPFAERQRGMLTPKVARIMVNLAGPNRDQVIYDPFCGTGTILMEAAMLGYKTLLGSDFDSTATTGTEQNLAWLAQNYQVDPQTDIFTSDATKAKPKITPNLIVTEPFLGKLKPKPPQIPNIIKGLTKLYIGTLKNFHSILEPGSQVIIIFPRFIESSHPSVLDNLIDKFDQLGYTTTLEAIKYARPKAVVARQIVRLEVK